MREQSATDVTNLSNKSGSKDSLEGVLRLDGKRAGTPLDESDLASHASGGVSGASIVSDRSVEVRDGDLV